MLQRVFQIIIILFILPSCGYTPIYSNLKTENININVLSFSGDIDINNLITQNLNKYKNQNSEKKYDIKFETKYNKESLTKDTAGNTTVYRLILNVDFYTSIKNYEKISFTQNFDMKKGDTEFDEEKYENIIKRDMINIIIGKFISQIVEIK
tara:strand:+ start:278 stop:733 length:456 start_codon:yes stop_codon:yes gene_type:complete